MARWLDWLRINIDGVVAAATAVVIAILALFDVFNINRMDVVSPAILLVLGLLATTMLRDRQLSASVVRDASSVRLLYGPEIAAALTMARRGTEQWMFKGGTGTYIRAVTLPECVNNARREQRPLRMQLEILDPGNESLCKAYAQFRTSLQPEGDSTGEAWTVDRTRKESFAMILAACWYRQRFTFLTVDVGLSSVMTTFRWDLSSSCVIMTQHSPNTPALLFHRDKPYYRDFSRELVASFKQTHQVPLNTTEELILADEPTVDQTRALFERVGRALPGTYSDRDVADIVRRALQPRNPY